MSPQQRKTLSEIIGRTNQEIAERIGGSGSLKYVEVVSDVSKENLEDLFSEMSAAWGIEIADLKAPGKPRDITIMRKICWLAAVSTFPGINLKMCANVLNRDSHSTVCHAVKASEFFLKVEDELFMKYYNPVKHFFDV